MSTATDDPKLKPAQNPLTMAAPIIEEGTDEGEGSQVTLPPGISAGETDEALEAEARRYGWAPKAEYRGRAPWQDVKAFVSYGRQSIPVLRANLEKAEGKLSKLQSDFGVLAKDAQGAKDLGYKIATREWEEKYDALKQEKTQALEDGDHAKVVAADEDLSAHKAVKPVKPAPAAPATGDAAIPPEFQGWFDANPWYEEPKNRRRANVICADIIAEAQAAGKVPPTGVALFEQVKTTLAEDFPDTFADEPPIRQTTHKSTRRTATTQTGARTYENLPPEAKAACDRYIARKMCTKEEYVAGYDWD